MKFIAEVWAAVAVDPKSGEERLLGAEFIADDGIKTRSAVVGLSEEWVMKVLDALRPEVDLVRENIVVVRFVKGGAKVIHHMRLDIKGALANWSPRYFKNMFQRDDGCYMSPTEAKETLLILLSKGHRYLPMASCPGFDPVENGCPGHEKAEGK